MKQTFKLIVALFTLGSISACSMFHEKEPVPAKVVQKDSGANDCTMPPLKEISKNGKLQTDPARNWVSCFRKTINHSFDQVHGQNRNELSATELFRLQRDKLVDLPFQAADEFEAIGGVMSLLNPEGRPGVTKPEAIQFADLLNEGIDLVELYQTKKTYDHHRIGHFIKAAIDIFPGKGTLTHAQVKKLSEQMKDPLDQKHLQSTFPLIRLFFRNSLAPNGETMLPGSSVRELLDLAYSIYQDMLNVSDTDLNAGILSVIRNQEAQILASGDLVKTYFLQDGFTPLRAQEVRSALIDGLETSASLAEDVLLLARRFLGEVNPDLAFSNRLIQPFLNDFPSLVADYKTIAQTYTTKSQTISRAQLLATNVPLLKSIAMKAHTVQTYAAMGMPAPVVSRKQALIEDFDAMESATNRFIFRKLFVAFGDPAQVDPIKGIYIPKKALSASEELEAKNLARLFLKLASSLSKNNSDDQKKSAEITIDDSLAIKADSVYQIMGLIGDRWFTDGNEDGYLNSEEFFSVITTFMKSTHLPYFQTETYKNDGDHYWSSPVDTREHFIRTLVNPDLGSLGQLSNFFPTLSSAILKMKDPASLFHALMERSDFPITAFKNVGATVNGISTEQEITLKDWVEPSTIVPANAIMDLIDRAFLKCDLNEDNILDWNELDCATNLLSGGLYYVTTSGAVNLDPGIRDGIILFSGAVYDPDLSSAKTDFQRRILELPKVAFKLYLAQGGLNLNLKPSDINSLQFSENELFSMVVIDQKPELLPIYQAEVRKVFGLCDLNQDHLFTGEAELNCLFQTAASKWIELLKRPDIKAQLGGLTSLIPTDKLEEIIKSDNFKGWFTYLTKGNLPVQLQADATSILDALESSIRRSCPLGFEVKDGKCLQP